MKVYIGVAIVFLFHTGDHVRLVRSFYSHHMLLVEVLSKTHIRVIHYTAADPNDRIVAATPECVQCACAGLVCTGGKNIFVQGFTMVREEEVALDPIKENVQIVTYGDKIPVFSPAEAIHRGRKRIGEQDYHFFNNNCETLIHEILTGKSESWQGDCAKLVTLIGAGVILGIGIGVVLTLGGVEAMCSHLYSIYVYMSIYV